MPLTEREAWMEVKALLLSGTCPMFLCYIIRRKLYHVPIEIKERMMRRMLANKPRGLREEHPGEWWPRSEHGIQQRSEFCDMMMSDCAHNDNPVMGYTVDVYI